MNIGMLWFDNDPKKEESDKVKEAAEYYERKYGADPNVAFVHPDSEENVSVPGMKVQGSKSVLPNHVWIGVKK